VFAPASGSPMRRAHSPTSDGCPGRRSRRRGNRPARRWVAIPERQVSVQTVASHSWRQ
jgi:hypothetical protein